MRRRGRRGRRGRKAITAAKVIGEAPAEIHFTSHCTLGNFNSSSWMSRTIALISLLRHQLKFTRTFHDTLRINIICSPVWIRGKRHEYPLFYQLVQI